MLKEIIEKALNEWEAKAKLTKTKADDLAVKLIRYIVNLFI